MFPGPPLSRPVIAVQLGPLTRKKLIAHGSECLQHMLDLARKYSDIGDRDRCMILRSNSLLTITGLLELYRPVLKGSMVTVTEDLPESSRKCGELLVLLADTSRQMLEDDGQRIRSFIMVSKPHKFPRRPTDRDLSTTTARIWFRVTLKQSFALSQPGVLRLPSYHSPHRKSGSSTKTSWNVS